MLADADVAWHRITVPKAPAAKLRAALSGLLEEALLDDDDALHLALAPDAVAGQSAGWRWSRRGGWRRSSSARQGRRRGRPRRAVAVAGRRAAGHFFDAAAEAGNAPEPALTLADADGLVCLPLAGSLARALLPAMTAQPTHWTTTPSAAAAAERWLGAPVHGADRCRAFAAVRALALEPAPVRPRAAPPRHARVARPGQAPPQPRMAAGARGPGRPRGPAGGGPERLGLAATPRHRRQAPGAWSSCCKAAHPQVRAVLDAPVQMQRETEALRVAAGEPGDGDLEALLAAAAAAWPDGQAPVQTLVSNPAN